LIGLARLAGKVNLRWRGVGEGHLHLVAQARLPFGKALAEVGDAGLQRRIVDEVAGFVRVGLEIKELEVADFGLANEFVTLVTDGALDVEEGQKDGVADGSLAAVERDWRDLPSKPWGTSRPLSAAKTMMVLRAWPVSSSVLRMRPICASRCDMRT
jgi:hypothetical protein